MPTLAEQIGNYIRDAIARGVLKPGERLPGQRELAEQFGVARETVRNAFRPLLAEGLIVAGPGRGTLVGEPRRTRWRAGGHWGVTIIEAGAGEPDEDGRRQDDRLAAVAMTREDAELIVTALNGKLSSHPAGGT